VPQIEKGIALSGPGAGPNSSYTLIRIFTEAGAPASSTDQAVLNAAVGSLYLRVDGGSSTTLYVCEGSAGNWVAK
jgi:hypothetical protein